LFINYLLYYIKIVINCDKPMTTKTKVCIERDSKYFQEDFNLEEHTIGKRDTCTKLASKFHTTVDVLKRFNYGILFFKLIIYNYLHFYLILLLNLKNTNYYNINRYSRL